MDFNDTYTNYGIYNPGGNSQSVSVLNSVGGTIGYTEGLTGFVPNAVSDTVNGLDVRGDLQSENFLTEVSGWQIKANGDVEFNDGTFRGNIQIGNPSGANVQIIGNDIFLFDDTTGGGGHVTGNSATIQFERSDGNPGILEMTKTASPDDDLSNIFSMFYTVPSTGSYNAMFFGRDSISGAGSINTGSIVNAINRISGVSENSANGFFFVSSYIDSVYEGDVIQIGDARALGITGTYAAIFGINGGVGGIGYEGSIGLYQRSASQVSLGAPFIPDVNNFYDIGSASHQIKDLYVGGTIHGGGSSNPSFTANTAVALTSGFGVSVPDASGNVFAGVSPTVLSDTKIDTNAINNLYPFGSDFDWLNATHVVIVYNETASTFKNFAVVATVNSITGAITLGTPVQLNTSGSGFNLKVAVLSSTLFVVAYNTTSTTSRFVACTVSGTTITQGTDATKTIAQTPQGFGRILKVDSTHFVWGEVGPNNGGSTKAMLIPGSISGTTITLGTEVDTTLFSGSNFFITCILMTALSSTQFAFVAGGYNGSTNAGHSEGIAFTVSSNAVSAGAATIFNGLGANFEGMVILKTLDTTHVVGMTNFDGACAIATVSGTTWTSGIAVDGSGGLGQNKAQQVPGQGFDLAVLSSTAFVTVNRGANNDLITCANTISGTTITTGSGITVDATINIASNGLSASPFIQFGSNNYVVISYQSSTNVNNLAVISISGTTSTTVWKTINTFISTIGFQSSKFSPLAPGSTQIGLLGSNTSGGSLSYFDIVTIPTQLIAGVASASVSAGATATIITGGIPAVFTGIGAGIPYYIIPTTGAYTTNSSGNYKLGLAVNSTSIIMGSNPATGVAYP